MSFLECNEKNVIKIFLLILIIFFLRYLSSFPNSRCNERKKDKVKKKTKKNKHVKQRPTYVKCFANILPGAPKSLKSLRFSRQIVLCMHRTLASLLRISSSSGVWKFMESLNLPLTRENFCRVVWNWWFILAILPSQQERDVSSRWVNFEISRQICPVILAIELDSENRVKVCESFHF